MCVSSKQWRRQWRTPLQYFAWKIPWMEEPGRLQSMGSRRVEHDWATSLSLFTFLHWRRKWHPTPVFLPGESQGRGNLVAAVYGVAQSWTWLKWLSSSSSQQAKQKLKTGRRKAPPWTTSKGLSFPAPYPSQLLTITWVSSGAMQWCNNIQLQNKHPVGTAPPATQAENPK